MHATKMERQFTRTRSYKIAHSGNYTVSSHKYLPSVAVLKQKADIHLGIDARLILPISFLMTLQR